LDGKWRKPLTCLRFPKVAAEPTGATQIFGNRIQVTRLHSLFAPAPRIQDDVTPTQKEFDDMVRENDLVAIFHSIHRVMKAEKVLKAAGADILLIPVPRQLTPDCGLALRFAPTERERVEGLLGEVDLSPAELYQKEGKGFRQIR
jgi:hypothetical protein